MHVTARELVLRLANPFTLAYGTSTARHNVLVRVEHGGAFGLGEAAIVPYYGHSTEQIITALDGLGLEGDPLLLEDALDALPPDLPAVARAALDMALHDLWGKRLEQPLYRLWGLNPARAPRSSFTVAMAADDGAYRAQLRAAAERYPLLKLKLGAGDWRADLRLVQIARESVPAALCVDANGAWSAQEAAEAIPRLAELGVLFVEQPLARDDLDGWRELRAALPDEHPPLIADESVQGVESLLPLAGLVDGVNVKLAKCGGLRAARQMIALARALGMRVLLGCMVESAVAVTAAAHLAPLADYADLDGNALVTNDPFRGVELQAGYLRLPNAPGLGVCERE